MKHNYLKHLLTMLLLLCCSVINAHDFEVDGIFYNITDETYKTVEVTYEGDYADYSNEYTGSAVIPENVTYGGTTYSVTSIGWSAFYGCTGLTSIEISNSVTSIGYDAFHGCTGLASIEIPNSVTRIGGWAFSYCTGLTSITIPNSVTSIGEDVFQYCFGLESIVVENGNSVYDSRNNCNAIIETATYALIVGCKNTVIPNSVTSIGNRAFDGCTGLTSITIPNSIKYIGYDAFYGCTGLASIEIPNSVTSIGDRAFSYCTGLTSIEIPNSVISIGEYIFQYCTGLENIVVENGNSEYDSRNNCNAIIETATNALFAGCKNTVIPNSVTSIGYYAFYGCDGLTSITIPNSVTSIGDRAFSCCTGLESITIPNSVTSIGISAFRGCTGLESITIPNSVTSIEDYAFYECSGLASITVNSKTPPAIQSTTFSSLNATLYVPYGAKATYQEADYWKDIANIVELEAPEYNLAVTAAGYASLYLSSAVEIPPGVEIYTATAVEGDLLKMQQVTGILPANTGAIVKADAGTYRFIYSDENPAAIEGNLLKGTEKATTVKAKENAQYYVLSKVDGVVGMYLAQLTDGGFLNNANKAYLELTLGDLGIYDDEVDSSANGVQLGAGFRFDFGGTTGVSELKTANGNVKTIYDLQGRKVENPTNGIYIINGKKMLVR